MEKLFAALLIALCAAAAARAATPVGLREAPVAYDGAVTLGDLFDGVEGAARKVVVTRWPVGTQAVLEAGQVEVAARAAGLEWDNAAGLRRVIVSMAAGPARADAPARQGRRSRAATLVYARDVAPGEVIAAADLVWSREAVAGWDAPRDPDAVIGKVARGPLREGAAVAARDLVSAKVVRRGDMISVDFASEGVSLSLLAKALNDAAAGEPVQAMNLSSKKVIDAVATAPGHAAVGPGADAVRAATPLQTAALR